MLQLWWSSSGDVVSGISLLRRLLRRVSLAVWAEGVGSSVPPIAFPGPDPVVGHWEGYGQRHFEVNRAKREVLRLAKVSR